MQTKKIELDKDTFFQEYTSQQAILKYTRATAGIGISYLLDHDYKRVYLQALKRLSPQAGARGIRMLEFGCGAGMNLVHLISLLEREGIRIEKAVGTDFSPVLINAAKNEAMNYLRPDAKRILEFQIAKNQSLVADLSAPGGAEHTGPTNSFDLILGVNTIRYCHAAKEELNCVRDIFNLLVPGGVCVVIDMNNRYPCFRSELRNRFRRVKKKECYIPSLEEYTAPFVKTGFEVLQSEHFCWIPHSAGRFSCHFFSVATPLLNAVAKSRAMRSLVVCRKPS
jgi:SAM-dependent methyltransferase